MKLLLILLIPFIPVFAQEPSFNDQFVSSEGYTKLVDRLDHIEESIETILEYQFEWDLPNWSVFALGTALAILFFSWQKNKQRLRRNSTKRSFVWALEFMMDNLPYVEQAVKNYYNNGKKNTDKQKVEDENSRLVMASKHIRFYLSISADVLDENFVRDVDFLCAVLDREPISDELRLDEQRFNKIKELNKKFLKVELKKEKSKLDADKLKKWKDELRKVTKGQ